MFSWRVTKYDPRYRNRKGCHLRHEWTSYSEIGKTFGENVFDLETYAKTEDSYVSAALTFLKNAELSRLQVVELENYNQHPVAVAEGEWLEGSLLEQVCRLNLRSEIWCKLEVHEVFHIHFGYDYYMYIGSKDPSLLSIQYATRAGLFVEPMPSPYFSW